MSKKSDLFLDGIIFATLIACSATFGHLAATYKYAPSDQILKFGITGDEPKLIAGLKYMKIALGDTKDHLMGKTL